MEHYRSGSHGSIAGPVGSELPPHPCVVTISTSDDCSLLCPRTNLDGGGIASPPCGTIGRVLHVIVVTVWYNSEHQAGPCGAALLSESKVSADSDSSDL